MSSEIPRGARLPIYVVSSINAVIFVMNLGVMTNNAKFDWFEFKAKSVTIDQLTAQVEYHESLIQNINIKLQMKQDKQ